MLFVHSFPLAWFVCGIYSFFGSPASIWFHCGSAFKKHTHTIYIFGCAAVRCAALLHQAGESWTRLLNSFNWKRLLASLLGTVFVTGVVIYFITKYISIHLRA